MAGKRKKRGAEFKAKVALEAIRGEATIAELVIKHGVRQTVINTWKRQAIEGMSGVFSGKAEARAAEKEGEIEKPRGPDRPAPGGAGFFGASLRPMSVARRREMIELRHPSLPVARRCALVGISRSAWYEPRRGESALNLTLTRLIDARFLETPFHGGRRMARRIRDQGDLRRPKARAPAEPGAQGLALPAPRHGDRPAQPGQVAPTSAPFRCAGGFFTS